MTDRDEYITYLESKISQQSGGETFAKFEEVMLYHRNNIRRFLARFHILKLRSTT